MILQPRTSWEFYAHNFESHAHYLIYLLTISDVFENANVQH